MQIFRIQGRYFSCFAYSINVHVSSITVKNLWGHHVWQLKSKAEMQLHHQIKIVSFTINHNGVFLLLQSTQRKSVSRKCFWLVSCLLLTLFKPTACTFETDQYSVSKIKYLLSLKSDKNQMLIRGCSIPNVLNLEILGLKIHNYALQLDVLALFCYNARRPIFSRIHPALKTAEN